MMERLIDSVDAFAARYRRPLAILGGLWLGVSWASNAHFIDLPRIPLLTGTSGAIASGAFAALWWGWINPRIERRRAARKTEADGPPAETAR